MLGEENYLDHSEVKGHWPVTVMAAIVLVRFLGRSERTYGILFMQVMSKYNFGGLNEYIYLSRVFLFKKNK